jgi:transcriptional antiterminator RfaH
VAPTVIEMLQRREGEGAFDVVSPLQRLRLGDAVRVTEGPFEDLVGRLVGLADHERIHILLELLGRTVRAEVAATAVEAA